MFSANFAFARGDLRISMNNTIYLMSKVLLVQSFNMMPGTITKYGLLRQERKPEWIQYIHSNCRKYSLELGLHPHRKKTRILTGTREEAGEWLMELKGRNVICM